MRCPEYEFLKRFSQEPDEALQLFPEFEEHLEKCSSCRERLDRLAKGHHDQLLDHVLGKCEDLNPEFPEIENYRIVERVGRGGFSSAFRAIHTPTGEDVAVKMIYRMTPEDGARFDNERRILSQQKHPNIVVLRDAGYIRGGYFLVYNWMDSDLSTWIKSNDSIPLSKVLKVVHEVASAVDYLHSIDILHRDLKPSNILIDQNLNTKLADFGIAKKLEIEDVTSKTVLPLGTPNYMAPEQTGLVLEKVGIQTDIYGLGALLYALLVGRPPFVGEQLLQICQQVSEDEPIYPSRLRPGLPKQYDWICLKCLEKDKRYRYQHVSEFIEDLRRAESGKSVQAKPVPINRRLRIWSKRHPKAVAWAAATTTVVAMMLAFFLWEQQRIQAASERLTILGLYEKLKSADSRDLPIAMEAIEKLSTEKRRAFLSEVPIKSPVDRLRVGMTSQSLESLTVNDFVDGVRKSNVFDLSTLSERIRRSVFTPELNQALFKEFVSISDPEDALKVATLLSNNLLDDTARKTVSEKISQFIEFRPHSECALWAECLREFATETSEFLIRKLESLPVERRDDFAKLTEVAIRWNVNDTDCLLRILERSSVASLRLFRLEPDLFSDELGHESQKRWQTLRSKESLTVLPIESTPETTNLEPAKSRAFAKLLTDFSGLATVEGGLLLRVPGVLIEKVLADLNTFGYSAIFIQAYSESSQEYFALTFESSAAKNLVSRNHSLDRIDELAGQENFRRYRIASICPDESRTFADVLWQEYDKTKGPSTFEIRPIEPQDLTWPTLPDSEATNTRSVNREYVAFRCNDDLHFGYKQQWAAHSADPIQDATSTPLSSPLGLERTITSKLDFGAIELSRSICCFNKEISLWSIHPCAERDFLEKAKEYLQAGIHPKAIFKNPNDGRIGGFWELNEFESEIRHRSRAMVALLSWIGDEASPLIQEFRSSKWPSCRTWVIHAIAEIDNSPDNWYKLFKSEFDYDQIYAWIVAGSSFRWENVDSSLLTDVSEQMYRLVNHTDSAVSFSARWFLEQSLKKVVEVPETPSEIPTSHRFWFYSKSGIPFVVINTDSLQVVGDGTRLPWNQEIGSNVAKLDRAIAISAVEIPRELLGRFLDEHPNPSLSQQQFNSPLRNTPAMGINYNAALRFCRWLSLHEGFDENSLCVPEVEWDTPSIIENANIWHEDMLNKEGYRLPTGVEWEIACRCGTISTSFLGESDEYLSHYAWNSQNAPLSPMPVAKLAPNPWGFFDILGNVYEVNLGSTGTLLSEQNGQTGLNFGVNSLQFIHVRGGSFLSNRAYCVAGTKNSIPVVAKDRNTGFRIVRTLRGSPGETRK